MARSASQHSRRAAAKRSSRPKNRDPFGLFEPTSAKTAAWQRRAAMLLVFVVACLLLWIALGPHKIGDYYTETDFYGSYAQGARLIQSGHLDPSRYTVVGPVYELLVAAIGFATRDLFRAAELVAILAACCTLILWFKTVARRVNSSLALWTVLFLAVNPTFFRYAYSVTTDALGTFMQAAAIFVVFVGRKRLVPLWAGMLAAAATLTRYNAIYLFPGALLYYACFDRGISGSRRRAMLLFLVGFAIVMLPWLGFSIQSGQMPGGALFHNIAYDIYSAKGVSWDRYAAQIQPEIHSLQDVVRPNPVLVLRRELANVGQHLMLDAKRLLGWPVAVWCIFGLLLSLWDRSSRRLLPIWILGALLFITLVPAIHSERYSLPLAPIYLTLAGAAAASTRLVPAVKGRLLPLKWVLALIPLFVSGTASFNMQREVLHKLPVEVLEAAKAIERTASQGARIMARKPHVAYYAGLTPAPFPVVSTLPELARYCASENVKFIYFSWPEANARAYFTYLLDPEARVPGLRVERFLPEGPAVLYRIEPGFGTIPAWFANDSLRTLHVTRAISSMGGAPWRVPYICGTYAYEQEQFTAALEHLRLLAELRPDFAETYFLAGQSYAGLAQPENATLAYSRALEIRPDYPEARLHLGLVLLQSGRSRDAALIWRPIVGAVRDSSTLTAMIELYESLGDRQAALKAREALARRQPQPGMVP